ncbi:DEKNAAC103104 [Brettanomyces naardenensis]|uniref:1,3-beta-glucan synthase n=1 Tax=Brettanomyces naardenensis TaxID=13370 RepID=A0A448YMJ2_BRENA|nr:DEKNAAC103104 [Brettanomyces naardenensis]
MTQRVAAKLLSNSAISESSPAVVPLSTISERTAPPFSAFRTPFINTSRYNNIDGEGDVFGVKQFVEELGKWGEEAFVQRGVADLYDHYYDPYPAWSPEDQVPITQDRIQLIFVRISRLFGFQHDNARNMYDYMMRLLDSRASRMGPDQALKSLHADYIGGQNSNYRKWYFGSQRDIEDNLNTVSSSPRTISQAKREKEFPLKVTAERWVKNMSAFLPEDRVIQLAIYLLIWGEANSIRFMPECICFIFKCCVDTFYSLDFFKDLTPLTASFLDHAITPLYNFYRDQLYEKVGDSYLLRDKDHTRVIGYDDINQTFWFAKSLERIELQSKQKLLEIPPHERYLHLDQINWPKSVRKTYYEYRSWFHVVANFNRIWNIHIGIFWYYTCFNCQPLYTEDYDITVNNKPTLTATLSVLSIAGSVVSFINLVSLFCELVFVPRRWPGALPIFFRIIFMLLLFLLNAAPAIYLFAFAGVSYTSSLMLLTSMAQFIFSLFTFVYCSITPLSMLTSNPFGSASRRYLSAAYFTNSICKLQGKRALASCGLWMGVFTSKLLESYFFLTLSLKDPVRELSIIRVDRCIGEHYFGNIICRHQPIIIMILLFFTSMILFFLDTYLWYIIWNTTFSVCRSFYCGVSIWTPWKNLFVLMPIRIASKILNPNVMVQASTVSRKIMVSKIWNSIVISLYREHLISIDHLEHLIYQLSTKENGEKIITEPLFFIEKEDKDNVAINGEEVLNPNSEASRRLSFFAHSLSTPMPKAPSIEEMPTFSVLIPHYSEKITLSLHEIIRKEGDHSNITLLEYLKHLYPEEWHNFVRDTKLLAAEKETDLKDKIGSGSNSGGDLPYYTIGFKAATPEYILRTRIWASLRVQTLFRTISGFMNYARAIKLLYSTEMADSESAADEEASTEKANVLAERKFHIVTSLQRMNEFDAEQEESKEFLLRSYPELQVCYLNIEKDPQTNESTYYSALIDGNSEILANGQRKPKYKIRLSGNPILGDGKSDNQNHAIIFCRGEYCQLIDANQDNYLEECLKIRSLLMEFEELAPPADVYGPSNEPVAIVGTREYIFSENVGVLGDVAAGKEQTFGTLSARTLAFVGGKLHYGHPDFLNSVFMTTRGGYSKSQKGLHLNEDIYAGINATLRSGRIKHCEYLQCGKGRDLGFSSILNFTTKIGSGMSEQMLSREYFYMGTQLPLDRFLSFYYAHPGFHMNNVFIMLSLKLFMLFCINLAALTNDSVICIYDKDIPFTDKRTPIGCYNLIPVIEWVQRCIFSIFLVFGISFIPLCVQELMERGIWKCVSRLSKHFVSLSPMFEVFVCRVYSQSLVNNFALGGAKYIATGRGLSTTRTAFHKLYSRFSHESFYLASGMFLTLLYTSLVMWRFSLVYFWCTVMSLLFSPFWFNPDQFSFSEFFIDYRRFLQWLTSGNARTKKDSWLVHVRDTRMQITGSKRRRKLNSLDNQVSNNRRPSVLVSLTSQLGPALISTTFVSVAFLFSNAQNEVRSGSPTNSFLRLLVVSLGPIAVNMVILIAIFAVSLAIGPLLSCCSKKIPALLANATHILSVINYLFFFDFLLLCQNWEFSKAVLGACAAANIQNLIFKILTIFVLSREFKSDSANKSWWTGLWLTSHLGWHIFTQPLRELVCKIIEMSMFTCDFLVAHFILVCQFPVLLIPYIDKLHSFLLLWLKPEDMLRRPFYSSSKRRHRTRVTVTYLILFILVNLTLFMAIAVPYTVVKVFDVDFDRFVPDLAVPLLQPIQAANDRKGLKNYAQFDNV